jgi:HD-like signal output (HDOD) protein
VHGREQNAALSVSVRQVKHPMETRLQSDQQRAVERRIEQVYELPSMPDLGRRFLKLREDSSAGAPQLARVIQLDPSLAAQVIRYASSSCHGYPGRVSSVQDAIGRVLGYDIVLNLALGLAAGRSFRIPDEGPLGLSRFWEHAVLSAVLVHRLGASLPREVRPDPGFSYLCGLLHDFGILLLGHLFPPEFQLLNRFAAANPQRTLPELECQLLGMGGAKELLAMGHARIGAWLMQAWKMPESVAVALLEHHNADYRGEHEVIVHLVQLSDFLQRYQIKLPEPEALPESNLGVLALAPERALAVTSSVWEAREQLAELSKLAISLS